MTKLMLIWDYDTPIARITATKPYNYHFEKCLKEEGCVKYILDRADELNAKYTFAVVGYGAERSVYPFDVRHVIKEIADRGHEIASHSWKHEWLPFLSPYQLDKTMERSKYILEDAISKQQVIKGFVLPHDRPMSWYSRFALSLGDRTFYPKFPGASIDGIAKYLKKNGYQWVRVNTRPIWAKFTNWQGNDPIRKADRKFVSSNGMHYVPEHAMGFGEDVVRALNWAIEHNRPFVLAGHPAVIGFNDKNMQEFDDFMTLIKKYINSGDIEAVTVSQYLNI